MTWRDLAACAGMDPDLFHPHGNNERAKARAVAVCAGCPARPDCLTHAIDNGEQDGIWGGCDPDERRKVARRRRKIEGPRPGERTVTCDICGDPFHTVNPRQRRCGELACRNRAEADRRRKAAHAKKRAAACP